MDTWPIRKKRFFVSAIIFEAGLGLLAILAGYLLGLRFWNQISWNWHALTQSLLALFPILATYFVLKSLPVKELRRIDELVRRFYRENMLHLSPFETAMIAAAAGFGEEMLFRGFLQGGVSDWLRSFSGFSPWWDVALILFVSCLFGAAHAVTKTYALLAVLVSVYFGFLLLYSENLLVPVLVHAFYDFFVFIILRREVLSEP